MDAAEVLARLEVLLPRLEKLVEDHEARIRALEASRWKVAGALALAAVLIPIVLRFVG